MLAKKDRLPVKSYFRQKAEREITRRFFVYKWFPKEKESPRVGVVVGKKIHKIAAKRNELRRSVYSHIQTIQKSLIPTHDVLIIALRPIGFPSDKHGMIDELTKILCSKHSS